MRNFASILSLARLNNYTIDGQNCRINMVYERHPFYLSSRSDLFNSISFNKFNFHHITQNVILGSANHIMVQNSVFENSQVEPISIRERVFNMHYDNLSDSTVDIRFCTFRNCQNTQNGGAITIESSNLTIKETLFIDCEANTGGAIYTKNTHILIVSSNFSSNNALKAGALACYGGTVQIDTSLFFSNTAELDSGAIYIQSDTFKATANTFVFNFAQKSVSAATIVGSTVLIRKSNFFNNECDTESEFGVVHLIRPLRVAMITVCMFSENKELNRSAMCITMDGGDTLQITRSCFDVSNYVKRIGDLEQSRIIENQNEVKLDIENPYAEALNPYIRYKMVFSIKTSIISSLKFIGLLSGVIVFTLFYTMKCLP